MAALLAGDRRGNIGYLASTVLTLNFYQTLPVSIGPNTLQGGKVSGPIVFDVTLISSMA
ncbi:hypothetical protein [Arenimonas composti]|uniref:hypothetical protein n=1 Tax=Arenimonas composti TaxID=370776 RepID=UPI0012B5BEC4|nr:hypothetical protein [Arenimonas composti]